jgi:hypothetical protein
MTGKYECQTFIKFYDPKSHIQAKSVKKKPKKNQEGFNMATISALDKYMACKVVLQKAGLDITIAAASY